jgi:hypothetical protein
MLSISSFDVALGGFVVSALIGVWNVVSSMKKDVEESTSEMKDIESRLTMLEYRTEKLEKRKPRWDKGGDTI